MKHICGVCNKEVVLPGDHIQHNMNFFHVTCALMPSSQLPERLRERLVKLVRNIDARRLRHDTRRND